MGSLHRSFLVSFSALTVAFIIVLYFTLSNVTAPHEPFNRSLKLEFITAASHTSALLTKSPQNYIIPAKSSRIVLSEYQLDTFQPFSPYSDTNIWDLFPPDISCPDIERVGKVGDGGKWLCGLSSLSGVPNPLIYSYGISTDASFEHTLVSNGYTAHAFDPSIGDLPAVHKSNRITFHKQGLADHTGHTPTLLLVEHLIDTMARLNHTYVDILKVDIEGAEWDVFTELFPRLSSSAPLFGQLLIELHYSSVKETVHFFEGMKAAGYYSYSREVNLHPCITGGLPVAVEYSFLHSLAFDTRRALIAHAPLKPISPPFVSRGVIYYLTRHVRVAEMKVSLRLLYENVHKTYMWRYPVLIFHDDLTPEDTEALQSAVPLMRLTFIVIHFRLPEHLESISIPDRTTCSAHSSTIGYRHMIMFHATWVHDYLLDPANGYSNIDYIWRLDDDSQISSPLGYDLFQFMDHHRLLYGFVNTVQDDPLCVEGMWDFVRSFIEAHEIPDVLVQQFTNWTEGRVVYNNFEISRVSIWKHPLWRTFISDLDKSGKIYTHRWGDAPIHTVIMLLLLSPEQVHAFSDISYRHLPFVNQTARGLPPPMSDPFTYTGGCAYYNGWHCYNETNATSVSEDLSSPLNPLWMQTTVDDDTAALNPLVEENNNDEGKQAADAGVLYTFAHTDREEKLAATIQSFYNNYLRSFPTPVVVFFPDTMNVTLLRKKLRVSLSSDIVSVLEFASVDLRHFGYSSVAVPPQTSSCGESNLEYKAASVFLVSDAIDVLHRMKFSYFFRFADDSHLMRPITYDVFQYMITNEKLYGFVSIVKDNPSCIDGLWEAARRACESTTCSSLFSEWPVGSVVYTNFEVSHISIWRTPVFVTMVMLLKQQLSEGDLSHVRWSDAAIHTIGVVTSVTSSSVHNFVDIRYQANMPYASRVIPYASYDWEVYSEMEKFFSPRRFGWIGGDVGASFLLPSSTCNVDSKNNCDVSRFVWLFGDSFVGTSSLTRRIEGTLVSNSVAIADMRSNRMKTLKYFWKSTDDGRPLPVFESSEKEKSFWPYDGVSIFSSDGLRVLVLGQMSTRLNNQLEINTAPDALSFTLHSTVMQIVLNPYDIPELWRTEITYFPPSHYQWASVAIAEGKSFGLETDIMYLLGSYRPDNDKDELFGSAYHVLGQMLCSDALGGHMDRISVLDQNGQWTRTGDMKELTPRELFPLISSEASLHYNHRLMLWTITGLQLLTVDVVTCTSQTLEGEWACLKIAPVVEQFRGLDYISYAARAHPELDTNASSVVSYVTNTAGNPHQLFHDSHMGIYYPTFVELFS